MRSLERDQGAAIDFLSKTTLYRCVGGWFFVSLFLVWDVLLEVVCRRLSTLTYLLAALFGAWVGGKVFGWLAGGGWGRRLLRVAALFVCVLGLLGAVALPTMGPRWDSRCSHRYCGRALGISLFESPFPAGSPSCRDLHRCGNEYHHALDPGVRETLDEMLREGGCEPL